MTVVQGKIKKKKMMGAEVAALPACLPASPVWKFNAPHRTTPHSTGAGRKQGRSLQEKRSGFFFFPPQKKYKELI